jgi:hypothetical protein
VQVRALCGDVNGDGRVSAVDLVAVRRRLLRPVGLSDFLLDVDLDGAITTLDLLRVRRQSGVSR